MEAGVRLPLNMKYYELLSIYQYLNMALIYWGILKCLIADHLGSDQKLLLEGVENLTPKQKIK